MWLPRDRGRQTAACCAKESVQDNVGREQCECEVDEEAAILLSSYGQSTAFLSRGRSSYCCKISGEKDAFASGATVCRQAS